RHEPRATFTRFLHLQNAESTGNPFEEGSWNRRSQFRLFLGLASCRWIQTASSWSPKCPPCGENCRLTEPPRLSSPELGLGARPHNPSDRRARIPSFVIRRHILVLT